MIDEGTLIFVLCCGAQTQIVLVSLCESYHILLLLVTKDEMFNLCVVMLKYKPIAILQINQSVKYCTT